MYTILAFHILRFFAIPCYCVVFAPRLFRNNIPDIFVFENVTVGSVIVSDIHAHLRLSPRTVVRLGPGSLNLFFRLNNETGQLITANSVDLESPTLCRAEKSCCRTEHYGADDAQIILRPNLMSNPNPTSSEISHHMLESSSACRLMAFVLSSTLADDQLSPLTKLYVTIVDLNDNPPVFLLEGSNPVVLRASSVFEPPSISIAFLEGTGGLNDRQAIALAYDRDFSLANRVKCYWLEWTEREQKDSQVTSEEAISHALTINEDSSPTWITLGPFRLTYLEAGRTLSMELETELDRERKQEYHLRLVAEDGGGLTGALDILVKVVDVNEFAPVFVDQPADGGTVDLAGTKGMYHKHYSVQESLSVGSEIGRVRAVDQDHSEENFITYHLGPGNPQVEVGETFQLNAQTGLITLVQPLDYEKIRKYRLIVIAQDGSKSHTDFQFLKASGFSSRRSSTGIVEISVTDVNDNAPIIRFEKDQKRPQQLTQNELSQQSNVVHEVSVAEDTPTGSPIIYFSVTDHDLEESGRVSCSLKNWTDHFRLREFTGLFGLETSVVFDREMLDIYYLTIWCHDHGVPELHSSRTILIHIEDVNDSPPTFPLPVHQFQVLENSPFGTLIKPINRNYPVTIAAIDPDLNSTLIYSLESKRSRPDFMKLNASGSFELSKADNLLFQIDPVLGSISTRGEIDREAHDHLSFLACADDGKHSACTEVTVLILDVNDNEPQFERDTYVLSVTENLMPSKPLLIFHVTDADADNQGFHFELLPEDYLTGSIFDTQNSSEQNNTGLSNSQVNFEPGTVRYHFALRENMLYLRRPLDRELRSSYQFFVRVTDMHPTAKIRELNPNSVHRNLTSRAEIFVDVEDVNDHMPVFVFPNSTGPAGNRLSVSCHETMGSSVGRLRAFDMDFGPNASVIYSIVHTPEVDQIFYLDSTAGELFVNTGQLEDKCDQNIIIVVSVDDQGPTGSKGSRKPPIERLLINFENKPTLAELLAAETKQRVIQVNDIAAGLGHSRIDVLASTFAHDSVYTRTVLSVILGGSTLFLICLLAVWMLLLLYGRARRRRRMLRQGVSKANQRPEPELALFSAPSASPGCLLIGSLRPENRETKAATFDGRDHFTRKVGSTEQVNRTSDVAFHYPCDLPNDSTYPTWAAHEKPCLQDQDMRYAVLNVDSGANPKYASRPRSIASLHLERRADHKPTAWRTDEGPSQKLLHFNTCSKVHGVPHSSIRGATNPTIQTYREAKFAPSLGRLLPKWIVKNVLPRSVMKPCVSVPSSVNVSSECKPDCKGAFYGFYDPASTEYYSPKRMLLPTNRLHNQTDGSSNGSKLLTSFGHPVYATLGKGNLKTPQNVCATLNNCNSPTNVPKTSSLFLTPPTHRRVQTNRPLEVSQSQSRATKGEYTSLLKAGCCNNLEHNCPTATVAQSTVKAFSSIQLSSLDESECGAYVLTDTVLPHIHSGEAFYPFCCTPIGPLDSACVHCTGASPCLSNSDSGRTCPQWELLGESRSAETCCHGVSNTPTNTECVGVRQAPVTQCSIHERSMQDMLNSCV